MFVEEDKAGSVVFYNSHETSGGLAGVRKMAAKRLVSDADKCRHPDALPPSRAGRGGRLKVNITQRAAV